ncbi:MAG: cellobiose phosphorylase, partial [Fervidobacterium sp.]
MKDIKITKNSSGNYYFDEDGRFVIENYNETKPFASFLPGIAGKKGIPLWVFYVNRGQAIASFGIVHKDNPIMEFHPAFRSYKEVFTQGFRTFLKFVNGRFYEPFTYLAHNNGTVVQSMHIGKGDLKITEMNKEVGLEISVTYFTLSNERLAALIRLVELKNIADKCIDLEILDGLPVVLPYGLNDYGLKHVGNTLKAWMEVYNLESGMPVFKLRSSTEDTVEVKEIREGNFYISFVERDGKSELVKPIVDPDIVFGYNTSYIYPSVFVNLPFEDMLNMEQIRTNKVPCAFSPVKVSIEANNNVKIYTVVGHAPDISILWNYKDKFSNKEYLMRKFQENLELIDSITNDIDTHTSSKLFDEYSKQTYLDNVLRGGYPLVFDNGKKVYHIYSRKHGDLERDYNYFVLLPEYYSSGNANYRDVNQNRRSDVFFNPSVERFNVKFFLNLIQVDGYNPLVINGVRYRLKDVDELFLSDLVKSADEVGKLAEFFEKDVFTPGKLLTFIEREGIELNVREEEFLARVISKASQEIDAVHGEGLWTDHWTYNLDLVESYLEVYPDKEEEFLFDDKDYTYYDNYEVVLPRDKRFVLTDGVSGKVRQLYSLVEDVEKRKLIESRNEHKHVMRDKDGKIFK